MAVAGGRQHGYGDQHAYQHAYGDQHANEHAERGVLGDVGCEGWVNVIDASLLLQFIAGLLPSLDCEHNADVNGDGTISPVDVTLILQWLARLIDSLGPAP